MGFVFFTEPTVNIFGYFVFFWCFVSWLFLFIVSTSLNDWLERLDSHEVTCNVLTETLNATHSVTYEKLLHYDCYEQYPTITLIIYSECVIVAGGF